MTPLEKIISDHRVSYMAMNWYQLEAYEAKAKADIRAMAESARRSIGQQLRYAAARLRTP